MREYGGITLFFSHFLEYLGLPLPGETMMLFSGFMCSGWFTAVLIIIFGTAGTFCGSMLAYFIGFRYGEAAVLKIGKPFHITKESLARTNAALEKHEAFYIIFSRFIPGVRHVVPYITGIIKLSRRRFVVCNIVSSFIWCAFFVSAGKLLGQKWVIFERLANFYSITVLLILIFIFLVYKFGGRHRFIIYGVALPIFAFTAIALLQAGKGFHLFDADVYAFISKFSQLRLLFHAISQLDSLGALGVVAVVCAAVLWNNHKYAYWGRMIAVNFISCFILGEAVNLIFHRLRPQALGFIKIILFTFPSVNSMLSISFYGFIIYLFIKYRSLMWKIIISVCLSLMILATGASSVYLHEYYASDVLAGYAAGFSWLVLFIVTVKKLHPPLLSDGAIRKNNTLRQ